MSRNRYGKAEEKPRSGGFSLMCIGFLGYIMLMGIAYVWLDAGTNDFRKKTAVEEVKLKESKSELENVSAEMESLTGREYILEQIQRHRLGLRPAEPVQIRKLTLYPIKSDKKVSYFDTNDDVRSQ